MLAGAAYRAHAVHDHLALAAQYTRRTYAGALKSTAQLVISSDGAARSTLKALGEEDDERVHAHAHRQLLVHAL